MEKKFPNRQSIRLKNYDYSQSGLYFITICCQDRIDRFGKIEDDCMQLNEFGQVAQKCWADIPHHFPNVVLHEYCIMPNHIHGIIEIVAVGANNYSSEKENKSLKTTTQKPMGEKCFAPTGTSKTVGSIVRGFKIGVTKQIGFSVWQRNYYENIIRSTDDYIRISTYIAQNPQNWRKDNN